MVRLVVGDVELAHRGQGSKDLVTNITKYVLLPFHHLHDTSAINDRFNRLEHYRFIKI